MLQRLITEGPVASIVLVLTVLISIRALNDPTFKQKYLFNPYLVVHRNEWYRIFSSGFIHANIPHLLFNMIAFFFFAYPLEQPEYLGHLGFAALYVAGLAISHLPRLILSKDDIHYNSLGASGAVSAVILSMILFNPFGRISIFFLPSMPSWLFGLLYMGISFIASLRGRGIIAHDAHLWGSLAGIILTVLMRPEVASNIMKLLN